MYLRACLDERTLVSFRYLLYSWCTLLVSYAATCKTDILNGEQVKNCYRYCHRASVTRMYNISWSMYTKERKSKVNKNRNLVTCQCLCKQIEKKYIYTHIYFRTWDWLLRIFCTNLSTSNYVDVIERNIIFHTQLLIDPSWHNHKSIFRILLKHRLFLNVQ